MVSRPLIRFVALEAMMTNDPSELIDRGPLSPLAWPPESVSEIRRMIPVVMSSRKTSLFLFVSPATRFDASDENATYRPLPEIAGKPAFPFATGWNDGEGFGRLVFVGEFETRVVGDGEGLGARA